jgi:predicted NBD/HSP70 family sugar kinase
LNSLVPFAQPRDIVSNPKRRHASSSADNRTDAPVDEWSGDLGCGVQYFSQQAVGRLLPRSGIRAPEEIGLPEKLEVVQARMQAGDERAAAIYQTIGTCFGYSIAHYADFYDFRHLLVLGRVSSGQGGQIVLDEARRVLDDAFPDLSGKVRFQTPDETTKRHGQAVAAASLPRI